jgi:uncharacterized membrane protein YphA (DoxX/SURF4 family)
MAHGCRRFSLPQLKHYGLLRMLHEGRTDFSMALGLIFILIVGGGALSVDAARIATAGNDTRRSTPGLTGA